MTTNESSFKWTFGGRLYNIRYSLGSLKINFYFIMAVTEACKFTLLPPLPPSLFCPAPSPPLHLLDPILKLQVMYKGDIRAPSHFLASSIFGHICFTTSLSVPEFVLEWVFAFQWKDIHFLPDQMLIQKREHLPVLLRERTHSPLPHPKVFPGQ